MTWGGALGAREEPVLDHRELELKEASIRSIYSVLSGADIEQIRCDVSRNVAGMMALRLTRSVWSEEVGQEKETRHIKYSVPASWWDMFKQEVMPEWFCRRFPPKDRVVFYPVQFTISTLAEYPGYRPLPREEFGPAIIRVYDMPANQESPEISRPG